MRARYWLVPLVVAALTASASADDLEPGTAAPAWKVTSAKGAKSTASLADYKGKWVVLDFWGYWCGPCVGLSMPSWMDFAEKHKGQKDHFVIITFHETNRGVTNPEELAPKLESLKQSRWKGRDLPFPVFFDTTGQTLQAYRVRAFPTCVLIDPEGRIATSEVGHEGKVERRLLRELKKLAKKSAAADGAAEGDKVAEGAGEEQPKADTPKEDAPNAGKPKADTPRGAKPKGDKPAGEKPKADKPDSVVGNNRAAA
ncbi:MAG: redoxin domain-containing protein [Planctomycetia bacterium]|nr:MAG: redoxin domain-containing protein [Planctomycetia bacterium]